MPAPATAETFEIESLPENLFREPIDLLYADHFRQRSVCNALDAIIHDLADSANPQCARTILRFLEQDLAFHIADEEQDLFPRLRTRCRAEDRAEDAIDLLTAEHAKEQDLLSGLIGGLRSLAEHRPPKNESAFVQAVARFTEAERRHLFWENSFILPLARRVLTPEDLAQMGRAMAERRGLSLPA